MRFYSVLFFSLSLGILGCWNDTHTKTNALTEFNQNITVKIELLERYGNYQNRGIGEDRLSDYTLFLYTNVSCSNCLFTLNMLDSILKNQIYDSIEIKCLCYSNDGFEYFKFLLNENKISNSKLYYFLDTSNSIIKLNPFLEQGGPTSIILVDRNNNTLYFKQHTDFNEIISDINKFVKIK